MKSKGLDSKRLIRSLNWTANNGPARIDAGVLHTLQEAEDEGHTHAERRKLALNAANLLEADATDVENRIDALYE